MKKSQKSLAVIIMMTTLFMAACAVEPAYAEAEQGVVEVSQPVMATAVPQPAAQETSDSCAKPQPKNAARCRQMEEEILAATVRLEMKQYAMDEQGVYQYEDGGVSHATVIEGRYLLTHNHFALSLEDFQDGRRRELTVRKADGEVIVKDAPFGAFDVVSAAPQTLVFDFGDYGGQGLFATVGLSSARLNAGRAVAVEPGSEVAQVNWDGETARVDWVRVISVGEKENTPVLELDNYVERGASGGGVYYNGYHIANNWVRRSVETASGEVLSQYSVAALNSTDVSNADA